jgi:iron complex outermembrane receptor protein
VTASGRYDSYSEGFSHFSPKVGFKFTPFRELAIRGTYSQGFRAPTFAESGPLSSYTGFANFATPASFQAAHGGPVAGGNVNPYAQTYGIGTGLNGNPDLEPETSRSFTFGLVAQPLSWLSATVDYYNIKKENLIVAAPLSGAAKNAYFSKTNVADACAAVAAVGPGYSCNTIDGVDPLFPAALPRILILNAPFVNTNSAESTGVDFSITSTLDLPYEIKWTSKLEGTAVIAYDLITPGGTQHYAGTLGPYELSSGGGTPKYRGNWQNTLQKGRYTLSATAYYVGRIKEVATDEGNLSTDCSASLYTGTQAIIDKFCYVKKFINVDVSGSAEVREGVKLYANIGNIFDTKPPLAPAAYSTVIPNTLVSWHYAGLIGRTYKVGVKFEF